MRSRIEVDAEGFFQIKIPEDVIDELNLDEGDLVDWFVNEGLVELAFA